MFINECIQIFLPDNSGYLCIGVEGEAGPLHYYIHLTWTTCTLIERRDITVIRLTEDEAWLAILFFPVYLFRSAWATTDENCIYV